MKTSLKERKFYDIVIIDGPNLAFKYYSIMGNLKSSSGESTGILHGFICFLLKCVLDNPKAEIIIVWEGGNLIRKEEITSYKGNRGNKSDSFVKQCVKLKEIINLMGIKQLYSLGREGDDVAISIVSDNKDKNILLISEDRDWFQSYIHSSKIDIYRKKKIYNSENIKREEGFYPEKYLMYSLLAGKSSNNIRKIIRGMPKKVILEIVNRSDKFEDIFNHKQYEHKILWPWVEKLKKERELLKFEYNVLELKTNINKESIICNKTKNLKEAKKELQKLELRKALQMMEMVEKKLEKN